MSPDGSPEQIDRAEPPPRRPREQMIVRGVGVALALGLVGGLVMRPNLGDEQQTQPVATRKVEMPREPEGLAIPVAPAPQPVIPALPPLETAPPQTAPVSTAPTPQPRVAEGPVMRPYR